MKLQCRRIGTITLLDADKTAQRRGTAGKERCDVYASPEYLDSTPFYVSSCGRPIEIPEISEVIHFRKESVPEAGTEVGSEPFELIYQGENESHVTLDLAGELPAIVGTVLLQWPKCETGATSSDEDDSAVDFYAKYNTKLKEKSRQRRDVYTCRETGYVPYYFTYTGNRVLVLDPSRVHFFPGMNPQARREAFRNEQDADQRERERQLLQLEEAQRREAEAEELERLNWNGKDKRIGTISVNVYQPARVTDLQPEADGRHTRQSEHHVSTANVYASATSDGKPYYLTQTKNKIFVVDPSEIHYFCDDTSSPASTAEKPSRKKLLSRRQEELHPAIHSDDPKIGTIVVQKALKPGEKATTKKEILDVYGTLPQDGKTSRKPYMIARSGKKIFIQDRSAIRYTPMENNA